MSALTAGFLSPGGGSNAVNANVRITFIIDFTAEDKKHDNERM